MKRERNMLFLIFVIVISSFLGCSKNSKTSNNDSINYKSVSFKYVFSGFVVVENINDLPIDTTIISTENEWMNFKNKYLYYDIGYSGLNVESIDFKKLSVIYYSRLDAKADVYATAYQIDNILIENNKLVINTKPYDNNYKIIVTNKKNAIHRYVVVLIVDKKNLPK